MNFDFKNSRLFRIDVAENLIMNYPVQKYLSCLGDCPYFKKFSGETVFYTNSKRGIFFYNKLKQCSSKGIPISDEYKQYKGKMLRIELRFTSRLTDEFGKEIYVYDLYNKTFFTNILNKWLHHYSSILKINKFIYRDTDDLTTSDYLDRMLAKYIKRHGVNKILKDIDCNRDNFSSSVEASRCKKAIKDIVNSREYTVRNKLISELNKKVRQTVLKYT